ncbi:hypothetical protein [Tetzosporium hominis]|uniref:hypothetical protein n=1 Tax=Tetzosporium hominis TaxID=2020506 RepID=UPI0013FE10DB|nr:hypothetical protein [Tetzosporium hominis]
MWIFFGFAAFALGLAFVTDKKNKINRSHHSPINSNAKPGEDSNYTMGDNHYTHGS